MEFHEVRIPAFGPVLLTDGSPDPAHLLEQWSTDMTDQATARFQSLMDKHDRAILKYNADAQLYMAYLLGRLSPSSKTSTLVMPTISCL